jgi:hypothetical protein
MPSHLSHANRNRSRPVMTTIYAVLHVKTTSHDFPHIRVTPAECPAGLRQFHIKHAEGVYKIAVARHPSTGKEYRVLADMEGTGVGVVSWSIECLFNEEEPAEILNSALEAGGEWTDGSTGSMVRCCDGSNAYDWWAVGEWEMFD